MDFKRDRWGRPLVVPADGGEPQPYSRVSSYGQVLENQTGLTKWKQRMVVLGALDRGDLLSLASAARGDDRKLDQIVQQMLDAGGASKAANTGTAIHDILAQVDAGTLDSGDIPDQFLGPVGAWHDLLADLGWEPVADLIEAQVVNDRYLAAGSLDNICRTGDGRLVVVDKKTGKKIGKRPLAYMVQLAIYATSDLYDVETGQRATLDVDRSVAYIAHIPAAGGPPAMYEIDVADGLALADLAAQIKQAEKQGDPLRQVAGQTKPASKTAGKKTAPVAPDRRQWLADRIATILTVDNGPQMLAAHWPADLPRLSSDHRHTDADYDQIAAVLTWVEAAVEAPFAPADPATVDKPKPTKAPVPAVRDRPVEGKMADPQAIEALQATIAAMGDTEREIVMDIAKQCHEAGGSISLRQRPSVRRFEIARMLVQLATDWPDSDIALGVLRHVTGLETSSAGEIVGWLTIEQTASILEVLPELARTGEIIIGPTGQMTINTKSKDQ